MVMTPKIYQLPLRREYEFTIDVPENSKYLGIANVNGFPHLLLEGNSDGLMRPHEFRVFRSGQEQTHAIGKRLIYIGYYKHTEKALLYYVYEEVDY